jgi:hypothetical protein
MLSVDTDHLSQINEMADENNESPSDALYRIIERALNPQDD